MTQAMLEPAEVTIAATPRPYLVVAIGDCAIGTGPWSQDGSGAGSILCASVSVPGCPPTPEAIVDGLARAAELLERD